MLILADISSLLSSTLSILWVAIGLGLVIFFHELGHFAVAKMCGVRCEQFALGFWKPIWKKQWGETEYSIRIIPFGGYVKMTGQDDMDAASMADEEIQKDPRSYSSKTVLQRMAIISAGVIMNALTAVLFFAGAFALGVETQAPVIGGTSPKLPAWHQGVEGGDTLLEVNHDDVSAFRDLQIGVALSSDKIHLKARKPDGTVYDVEVKPDRKGTRRIVGIGPESSLKLIPPNPAGVSHVAEKSAAAAAKNITAGGDGLLPGDTIFEVDGDAVSTYHELTQLLARKRGKAVIFSVRRMKSEDDAAEEVAQIRVPPQKFRRLGLVMDIGEIKAIRDGWPAAKAGFQEGDKIVQIKFPGEDKPRDVGRDLDPLRMPDIVGEFAGKKIAVTVSRKTEGGEPQKITRELVPLDKPGWTERPLRSDEPLPIPSLGVGYIVQPIVVHVVKGSPAEKAGIKPLDRIESMSLGKPEGVTDGFKDEDMKFPFTEKRENDNWGYAFWMMQLATQRTATLTVSTGGKTRDVDLTPTRDVEYAKSEGDWYLPIRGFRTTPLMVVLHADSFGASMSMGVAHSVRTCQQIYLTLRALFTGDISPKELHGPIGIAKVAYRVSERGIADLLVFLGFLSINLAVLNFLPIPVLDGGHMVFLLWEGITRRKPNEKAFAIAMYIGLFFLLALMLFVIYLDLFVHKI